MNTTIENWFLAPNLGPYGALIGKIIDHPNPNVGIKEQSLTSNIKGKRNGKIITDSGTVYTIGYASEIAYEGTHFPKGKLFAGLPELTTYTKNSTKETNT